MDSSEIRQRGAVFRIERQASDFRARWIGPVATAKLRPSRLCSRCEIKEMGEVSKPRAQETLTIMDAALAKARFIAGEDFSVADITALVAIDFMRPARIERPAGLANLDRWYKEVSSRPSARA